MRGLAVPVPKGDTHDIARGGGGRENRRSPAIERLVQRVRLRVVPELFGWVLVMPIATEQSQLVRLGHNLHVLDPSPGIAPATRNG
jgi:hypothetical protein